MKTLQITQPGEIILTDTPLPVIQPDEVLVKVCYVGFCGSDLSIYSGKNALAKMPVIPGHEIGGTIEETGKDVPAHLIRGMSCTINPYTACGNCSSCRNGRPNACAHNQTLGVQRDGAMREFLAVAWKKIIVDENISPVDFCLVEPMSVGFHAVERGKVISRDTVMVLGCGMIGMGAIAGAARRGAQVIAVDVNNCKLSMTESFGATFTINASTESLRERLREITNHFGPDVVIEAAGTPATYLTAIEEVAFTGRVVCIGYAKEDIAFETRLFVQKELDIRGSRNALPEDFSAVIEFMKKTTFAKEDLIGGVYPPEKAQEALEIWKTNPDKIFRMLVEF